MKLTALPAFLTLFVFAALPARAWEAPPFPQAELIAVEAYADWCPNCKILDPELEKAREDGALNALPVLFVKLDYTDKASINQSKMLGRLVGIEAFMKKNGAGTGYVALLDADTKEELARFNRDSKADEIIKTINGQLESTDK